MLSRETSLSDDEDQDIERRGLSIEAARQRFANERVDAEHAGSDPNFPGSIDGRLLGHVDCETSEAVVSNVAR